ncbi:MAG: PAS domain S-box protein [Candidatus Lokiarchaeota archaeon]|nr:PAS domain S-box protein [Candidatus Lokiarchaeota archaeon]
MIEIKSRIVKILSHFYEGIAIVEKQRIIYVNEKFAEIYGYTVEELIKQSDVDLAIPEEREKLRNLKEKAIQNREANIEVKFWAFRKDGTKRYIKNRYFFEESKEKGDVFYILALDITDSFDQKALLESVFKAAPTGIGVVVDLQFKEVNEKFCDLIGYSREEVIGKKVSMIYPSIEVFKHVGKVKYDMIREKGTGTVETKFKCKDGTIIDVILSSTPIDIEDWAKGVTFTALDITERKRMENALRTEKNIFQQISLASPTGITMINELGKIVFANTQAEKVLGLTKDEITNRSYNAPSWKITSYNGSSFPDEELPFQKVKREKKPVFDIRHTIEKPNGDRLHLSVNAAPLFSDGNEFAGVLAIVEDITEKIQAERKLKESEETFRSIFESIPIGMHLYHLDEENNLIFMASNRSSDEILGVDTTQFIGKTIEEAFPPLVQTDIPERYKDLALEEGIWRWDQVDYEYEQIKGAYEVIAFHIAPNTMVASFIDSGERLEHQRKIIESKKQYRKALNRAEFYKDLFAHDINNILQNIKLSVQLNHAELEKLVNPIKLLESHHLIEEQVNRGAKLVSNIRKLSQIEEEHISLKKTELIKVLLDSISFVDKSYQHKNIVLNFKPKYKYIYIKANEFLREIFDNILLNAVKYTSEPKVFIEIKLEKDMWKNQDAIKLQFIDNGRGIPDQLKQKIFQRTYQESNSLEGTRGMGLGLSLVKKIVETYEGEIWVEDKISGNYSKGSNFVLRFFEYIDN